MPIAFLVKLGKTELKNADSDSYLCKDDQGNIQILAWDFAKEPTVDYASHFLTRNSNARSGAIGLKVGSYS